MCWAPYCFSIRLWALHHRCISCTREEPGNSPPQISRTGLQPWLLRHLLPAPRRGQSSASHCVCRGEWETDSSRGRCGVAIAHGSCAQKREIEIKINEIHVFFSLRDVLKTKARWLSWSLAKQCRFASCITFFYQHLVSWIRSIDLQPLSLDIFLYCLRGLSRCAQLIMEVTISGLGSYIQCSSLC